MGKDSTSQRLLAKLHSGELARLAAGCNSQKELAGLVDLSADAYGAATRGLRDRGINFPTFAELKARHTHSEISAGTTKLPPRIEIPNPRERFEEVLQEARTKRAEVKQTQPTTIAEELELRKEKAQIAALKSKLNDALEELEREKFKLETIVGAQAAQHDVEPIVVRERSRDSDPRREATPIVLASDWHIESPIDLEKVNGVNEYNLDIAHGRAQRFFEGFNYMLSYHESHFVMRDAILWLGGDLITGYLREENLEANELSPSNAIATLRQWLTDGIQSVLDNNPDIANLKVVCNSGNHGRTIHKPRPSTKEENSFEWILYAWLAAQFSSDPRVKFVLPKGSQTYVQVYDATIRFLHGDDGGARYAGGVGGLFVPLYRALPRWETVRHASYTCLGHWHTLIDTNDFMVNGSLCGYDEYALSIGARCEPPRQAFFLWDSKRGKSFPTPIWVDEAK